MKTFDARHAAALAIVVFGGGCASVVNADAISPTRDNAEACAYDRGAMLTLDEASFDQDMAGGWRAVAARPGCDLAAAELIATWRQLHPQAGGVVAWHEGQLRASAGQREEAIPPLLAARKPVDQDAAGWNHYVDATVGFLRGDRAALLAARERLQAVPYVPAEGLPPVKDGIIEVTFGNGQTMRMRWPPNIDVVDGLIACFDKPYDEAYGAGCRPPLPPAGD